MSEMLCNRSVLALVDGVKLWDMHRPLESDCEIQLLHFLDSDPYHSNRTFWRSCSLMLGSVLSRAFKDDIKVVLHSFPSPNGEFWILEILWGNLQKPIFVSIYYGMWKLKLKSHTIYLYDILKL